MDCNDMNQITQSAQDIKRFASSDITEDKATGIRLVVGIRFNHLSSKDYLFYLLKRYTSRITASLCMSGNLILSLFNFRTNLSEHYKCIPRKYSQFPSMYHILHNMAKQGFEECYGAKMRHCHRLATVILVFFWMSANGYSQESQWGKVILKTQWGKGPGECGLWQYRKGDYACLKDHPRCGPRSFALDSEGNIYILDTVNERVNKYSRAGRFIFSFPASAHHTDIVVSPVDGRIYLLSSSENLVRCYSVKGEIEKEIKLQYGGQFFTQMMEDTGRIRIIADGVHDLSLSLADGRSLSASGKGISGVEEQCSYEIVPDVGTGGADVAILGAGKRLSKKIKIKTDRPLARAEIFGVAPDRGCILLQKFCSPGEALELKEAAKDKRYYEVQAFSSSGELTEKINLPASDENWTLMERRALVKNDSLYVMCTRGDGVYLYQRGLK